MDGSSVLKFEPVEIGADVLHVLLVVVVEHMGSPAIGIAASQVSSHDLFEHVDDVNGLVC